MDSNLEANVVHAKNDFAHDPRPTDDLQTGGFFDDPSFLDSLPLGVLREVCAVQQVASSERPSFCYSRSHSLWQKFKVSAQTDDLKSSIALAAVSLRYVLPGDAVRPRANWQLARVLQSAWARDHDPNDLDLCIRHYRRAVETAAPNQAELAPWCCDLCTMLHRRYKITQRSEDIADALVAIERSIQLSEGNPFQAVFWASKGSFFQDLLREKDPDYEGQLRRMNECFQKALEICDRYIAEPAERPPLTYGQIYQEAAGAQLCSFLYTKEEADSMLAVEICRRAQTLFQVGSPGYHKLNAALCSVFIARAEVLNRAVADDPAWMEHAASTTNVDIRVKIAKHYIGEARRAIDATKCVLAGTHVLSAAAILRDVKPHTHPILAPDMEHFFHTRADADYTIFRLTRAKNCLDTAITSYELATRVSHKQFSHQFALVEVLIQRYVDSFDPNDIRKAVDLAQQAQRNCPAGNSKVQGECHRLYGRALVTASGVFRTAHLLKEGIVALERAAALIPHTKYTRALAFNDLGNAYCSLHDFEDSQPNLGNGIGAFLKAVDILKELWPQRTEPHPDILMAYNGLGTAMLKRYLAFHIEADLRSAACYFKESYESTNVNHPQFAARVSSYSYCCLLQYERSAQTYTLTEADGELQRALNSSVALAPDAVSILKTHRATLALRSYLKTDARPELERAILQFEEASYVEGLSPIMKASTLMDYAVALGYEARLTGKLEDFNEAFRTFNRAKELTPRDDCITWSIMYNMANLGYYVHETHRLHWGESFGEFAMKLYKDIAGEVSVPTNERLRSAEAVASLSHRLGQMSDASMYQRHALELLPEMIASATTRLEQLRLTRQYHHLARTAASISLDAGESASTAIMRLESGRAFLWDRLPTQTTVIEALARDRPELAAEFQAARSVLYQLGDALVRRQASSPAPPQSRELLRLERERRRKRYEDVLAAIRDEPGLSAFMSLDDPPDSLQRHAAEAPIIYINASQHRSDALVVTHDRTYSVALPLFSMGNIKLQGDHMVWAISALSKQEEREQAFAKFEEIMEWLWDAVAWPVLGSIDFSGYQKGTMTSKPRVIWVTTGWMGVFPIHAAGKLRPAAGPAGQPTCVHDMVVSTYTKSIKSLKLSRERAAQLKTKKSLASEPQPRTVLLVSMPSTQGNCNLDKVAEEVESLAADRGIPAACRTLKNPDASTVRAHLPHSDIAFFACHSEADGEDPARSAILLGNRDAPPTPLSASAIMNTKMEGCGLAYLARCESGSDKDLFLSDEGLSIAGAFHMAGVPHTVSGLWQIDDEVARKVSARFFGALIRDRAFDTGRTTEALHLSVQSLREEGVRPMLWAPFIHSGS